MNAIRQPLWLGDRNERGRANRTVAEECSRNGAKREKKEEFPGFMKNMLPGNSFPQICVVSVNNSVGNWSFICGQSSSFSKKLKDHVF
jgi:hypothetical protein